ncbi:MAG: endonuclease/exonuclease/phosphatase family protein [Patescibacteria group bacterium]
MESLREQYNVDIFCLNEAVPEMESMLAKKGYKVAFIARSDHHGVMIASRLPISNRRHYELVETMRRGSPHRTPILMADFMHQKRKITVATAHLTYFGPTEFFRRDREKHEVIKYIPPNNAIFGGDLNTFVFPFVKWTLKEQGLKHKVQGKTWRLVVGGRRTPIKMQLDHVFTTKDLSGAVNAKILPEQSVSDHFPILVTVS